MSLYRERLLPGPSVFIATLLLIPAALLVFLPINQTLGLVFAVILYAGCTIVLVALSPTIEVTEHAFIAGRAKLPMANIGQADGFNGREATAERGTRLDARAWLVIRGWISPVVRVQVLDETDPAPYWLVSTRHPQQLITALTRGKAPLSTEP